MTAPRGVLVMAPKGQALAHFLARQLWQFWVTVILVMGQPSQAQGMTCTTWEASASVYSTSWGSLPMAMRTRWRTISRSR